MRENMIYDSNQYQLRDYIVERIAEVIANNRNSVPGGVVFFGDSLTQYLNLGKFFPEYKNAYNSGVVGISSHMLLHLVDEGVIKYAPKTVFLMVGTNDLGNTVMASPRDIALNVKEIVEIIHYNLPECQINLVSCIPCVEKIHGYRAKGDGLRSNEILQMVLSEYQRVIPYDYVKFINVFPELLDTDGNAVERYYRDGLHINDEGYRLLVDKVKQQL